MSVSVRERLWFRKKSIKLSLFPSSATTPPHPPTPLKKNPKKPPKKTNKPPTTANKQEKPLKNKQQNKQKLHHIALRIKLLTFSSQV